MDKNELPIYCSPSKNLDACEKVLGEIEDFIIYYRSNGHWAAHKHVDRYIACSYNDAPELICFQCETEAPFAVKSMVKLLGIWTSY